MGEGGPPAVVMQGITKSYGPVRACSDVNFSVRRGEIHGLLGENGAGKTTLMKILVGLVPPEAGQIMLEGKPVVVRDPIHAADLGLVMAHQHFSLIERLRVWENVALAHRGRAGKREAVATVGRIGQRYGLDADPLARVEDLTVGQRQRAELIKCLSLKPDVLVLDEPTSVLTADESRELFKVLREVVETDGLAVVLISHKLDEVIRATDRVTIMRDGAVVSAMATADADAGTLARAMVGRDVLLQAELAAVGLGPAGQQQLGERGRDADALAPVPAPVPPPQREQEHDPEAPALAMEDVMVSKEGRLLLDGFSIRVRRGEIVGLAGVEGNGQGALGDLLSGLVPLRRGRILVGGQVVRPTPRGLLGAGVGVIPQDRHATGCVLQMSVEDNLVVADLRLYAGGGIVLDRRAIRERALELMSSYRIAAAAPTAPMRSLSGGNQQRVVVARELSRKPTVLLAVQPTRGLDVGAVEYMSEQLRKAASDGIGILLVSTELEEVLAIADRIAVIYQGRNVGEMRRDGVSVERLGALMGGHAS